MALMGPTSYCTEEEEEEEDTLFQLLFLGNGYLGFIATLPVAIQMQDLKTSEFVAFFISPWIYCLWYFFNLFMIFYLVKFTKFYIL